MIHSICNVRRGCFRILLNSHELEKGGVVLDIGKNVDKFEKSKVTFSDGTETARILS